MTFPRYPRYKDSGVVWLGEVPAHWEVLPLKSRFRVVGGSTPTAEEEHWGGQVTWVTPGDLSALPSLDVDASARQITDKGLASCGATLVPPRSLILSTRAPIGSLAIASVPLCTNQGCKSLIPQKGIESRFFAYLLGNSTEALNVRGKGTTFLELSGDELASFKVSVPPPDEQMIVARFLDHETGKIDALIEEQRRLIELLKEKRQAVISHAVTKGLDPNVPMKDSGVEWLGEVPAHWFVGKLKWHALVYSGTDGKADTGDIPLYGANGIIGFSDGLSYSSPKVLIGRVGSSGAVNFASRKFSVSDNALVVDETRTIDVGYLHFWAKTQDFSIEVSTTAQPLLTASQVKNFRLPLPQPNEQREIAAFLDRETGRIDALIGEVEQAISLMGERRSALISAAVTGKIDVRGWSAGSETQYPELAMVAEESAGYSAQGGVA